VQRLISSRHAGKVEWYNSIPSSSIISIL
jgi:hypothetical protein